MVNTATLELQDPGFDSDFKLPPRCVNGCLNWCVNWCVNV